MSSPAIRSARAAFCALLVSACQTQSVCPDSDCPGPPDASQTMLMDVGGMPRADAGVTSTMDAGGMPPADAGVASMMDAGEPPKTDVTVTISSSSMSVPPDGVTAAHLRVVATDANCKPVAGAPVTLTVEGAANQLWPSAGVTDADGVFGASLTSTQPGSKSVAATVQDTVERLYVPVSSRGCRGLVTFDAVAASTTPSDIRSGAAADFNGDGLLDVAFGGVPGVGIQVYVGDGQGGLTAVDADPAAFNVCWAASDGGQQCGAPLYTALATGDFNEDGNLDLATVAYQDAAVTARLVKVFLGSGDGRFSGATGEVTLDGQPDSMAAGDFNLDGHVDLAITTATPDAVIVLLGDGRGGFMPVAGSPRVGSSPSGIETGDFNGDGLPDLAVVNQNLGGLGSISVLLGDGTGSFDQAAGGPIPVGHGPSSLALGDFDGDGRLDVAVQNVLDENINVLLGDGAGGLALHGPPIVVDQEQNYLGTADFDGDGHLDLIAAMGQDALSVGTLRLLKGDGQGGFAVVPGSPFFLLSGAPFVIGDVNGDRRPDIVSVGGTLLGGCTPAGIPGRPATVIAKAGAEQVYVSWQPPADTGRIPITGYTITAAPGGATRSTAGETTTTFVGLAPGTAYSFTVTASNELGAGSPSVASNMVTVLPPPDPGMSSLSVGSSRARADGATLTAINVRLADSGGNPLAGEQVIFSAAGAGTFLLPASAVTDADGLARAQVSSVQPGNDTLFAGTGVFQLSVPVAFAPVPCAGTLSYSAQSLPRMTLAAGSQADAAALGDFNRDGLLDAVVTQPMNNTLWILLGDGTGGFAPAGSSPLKVEGDVRSVAIADFNNDGLLDLAAGNATSDRVDVLLGDGAGNFASAPGSPYPVGLGYGSVTAADFNRDGLADIAVANSESNDVTVLLGDGNGGFVVSPGSPVGVGVFPSSVTTGDFNGDHIPDLVVVNSGYSSTTLEHGSLSVLLGDGSGGFAGISSGPIPLGIGSEMAVVGDFNGDGAQDIVEVDTMDGINILFGDGTGAFKAAGGSPLTVVPGHWYISLAAGDLNGDGTLDLAALDGTTGHFVALAGDGKGEFTVAEEASDSPTDFAGTALALGDLNGDGILDVFAGAVGLNQCSQ